jgi:superfamily II DNA helicase RecQ
MALVHVAGVLGVASLYPQQIACLLSLFTARHVFCVMQTGFGKTFAYEGLVLLYDFLYNGDHRSKDYVRHFCPVLFVVNPLCSLMIEQTKAFNMMAERAKLRLRAAQLSSDESDRKAVAAVARRAPEVAVIHASVELLVDKTQPYRGSFAL